MVPNYLAPISDQINEKNNVTTFHIKCLCGNNTFLLAKLKSHEDNMENSFDKYWNSFKLPIFSLGTSIDKNGEKYVYGTTFFGIKMGKFYTKNLPKSNIQRIIKSRCCECEKEYILFDNKYYGYDALTENDKQQEINIFQQNFIWTKNSNKVVIQIRTDLPYSEFSDEFGKDMKKYSNAFGSIEIYTINNGKKRIFFEEETS